ncbi:hypothetical protein B9534_000836 [Shigella sonnei]|nr:hypothetical protein [Shigella sonnei]
MNTIYFVCNVICEESKDEHFSTGDSYEVLEKNDNYVMVDDNGVERDVCMVNGGIIVSSNSKFTES